MAKLKKPSTPYMTMVTNTINEVRTSVKTTIIKRRRRKFEWRTVLAYIIFPFWKLGQGLVWIYNNIFFEDIRTGYHVYYATKFSWGKLSFILMVIVIILVGILYL
jgi:hypothetical protein